ncbi:hypothetical protein D7X87_08535 [bacterium D16-54]|nr:hypothetical protein D7X87_08535 [bacterium D16-54]RKJ15172.1 hypothetical protein D7X65_08535 [bacterium D16-56]
MGRKENRQIGFGNYASQICLYDAVGMSGKRKGRKKNTSPIPVCAVKRAQERGNDERKAFHTYLFVL